MQYHLTTTTRYILSAVLIFAPLARASVKPWAVSIIEIAVLIAATLFLLHNIMDPSKERIHTALDRPLAALTGLVLLSCLFSLNRAAGFWAFLEFLSYIAVFYLAVHTLRTRNQVRGLVALLAGMGTFLSVFGLFKLWGSNPFPWWEYSDLGATGARLDATFGSPDHLAGYMEMVAALTLGYLFTGIATERKILFASLLMLFFTALILSLSRGGWIGLGAGLFFMTGLLLTQERFGKYRWTAAVTVGVLIIMLIVLSSTPAVKRILTIQQGEDMLAGRMEAWQGILVMIGDHPLLGTGPATFTDVFTQYQPPGLSRQFTMAHNDYLHFIAENGLPLLPIIVWLLAALYRTGLKKIRHPSRLVRGTALGALAGITALAVHSVCDFNLHIPANALLFTVLAAMICAPTPSGIPAASAFNFNRSGKTADPMPMRLDVSSFGK